MAEMVRRVRALPIHDTVARGIIERKLVAATGLKAKDVAVPKPKAFVEPPAPDEVRVTIELAEVADESTKAIARRVFQRNGVLCQVVRTERTYIHELEPAGIVDVMSQSATFSRIDEAKGVIKQAPPPPVAAILHARRTHKGVRVLEAVTSAPIFLADGSILQERGYNAEARVYLEPA
jgi:hypothetical protein